MSIQEKIDKVLESLDDKYITDQGEVTKRIINAEKVILLDTCFSSKLQHIDKESLKKGFENFIEPDKKIVVVITELALYEMMDARDNTIQKYVDDLCVALNKLDMKVLIIKEECIVNNIRPYVTISWSEWNESFVKILKQNKANLSKLTSRLEKDTQLTYPRVYEPEAKIPKDNDFIEKYIREIKERKRNKDSFVEELMTISVLIYSIMWAKMGSTRNVEVNFCTDDFDAAKRMKKAIINSCQDGLVLMKTICAFSFCQYLISTGVLTDKENTKEMMRKMIGDEITIFEKEEPPYGSERKLIKTDDAVEIIFSGNELNYCAENR